MEWVLSIMVYNTMVSKFDMYHEHEHDHEHLYVWVYKKHWYFSHTLNALFDAASDLTISEEGS